MSNKIVEEIARRIMDYLKELAKEFGRDTVIVALNRLCRPTCEIEKSVIGPIITIEMHLPPEAIEELHRIAKEPLDIEDLRNALRDAAFFNANMRIVDALTSFGEPVDSIDLSKCIYILSCNQYGSGYSCNLLDNNGGIIARKARDIAKKILKILTSDVEIRYRYIPITRSIEICIG